MTEETRTLVDITPTWSGLLPALLELVRQDKPENAVTDARTELYKMARVADRYVAAAKRAGGVINLEQAVDDYVNRFSRGG